MASGMIPNLFDAEAKTLVCNTLEKKAKRKLGKNITND